jgi:hypothetical protein
MSSATLDDLLRIARYHRQHERYYVIEGFERAAELRRAASALRALADRWMDGDASGDASGRYSSPQLQAAGCEDLNDPAALATAGILFMEGESEPAEIARLKAKLAGLRDTYMETGRWLEEKMDAGWQREAALLNPEYADVAYARHMVLMRTTLSAAKMRVASRLIGAAHAALAPREHKPAQVRADPESAGRLLRTTAWLIDAAAALIAEQAGDLGASDPGWTAYIEDLTGRAARAPTRSETQDA